jgi:hypothetical protein
MARVIDEYRGAIYLAKLRVDGFVSLRAAEKPGYVDTRPVLVEGRRLFVNATAKGALRVEVTRPDGRAVLPGWSAGQCIPVTGDHLRAEVVWPDRDLAELKGQRVRLRFHLQDADLYSFWLEP